jgi:hypothetical protein
MTTLYELRPAEANLLWSCSVRDSHDLADVACLGRYAGA